MGSNQKGTNIRQRYADVFNVTLWFIYNITIDGNIYNSNYGEQPNFTQ